MISPGRTPAWTDAAISRYTDFVSKSRNTPMRKYQLYRRGLEAKPSPKVQNKLLKALSKTLVFPALTLAMNYMDAPATAETAAMVVKTVAAKNPALGGETVAAALKRPRRYMPDWPNPTPTQVTPSTRSRDSWPNSPQRDTSRYRSNRADGKPWSAIPRPARQ